MEKQIFEYEGYDLVDDMCSIFYDCKLKIDFSSYKVGDEFSTISVDFEKGIMELYEDNEILSSHELLLSVK